MEPERFEGFASWRCVREYVRSRREIWYSGRVVGEGGPVRLRARMQMEGEEFRLLLEGAEAPIALDYGSDALRFLFREKPPEVMSREELEDHCRDGVLPVLRTLVRVSGLPGSKVVEAMAVALSRVAWDAGELTEHVRDGDQVVQLAREFLGEKGSEDV